MDPMGCGLVQRNLVILVHLPHFSESVVDSLWICCALQSLRRESRVGE